MSKPRTKTAAAAIARMYAIMASKAAQRAVEKITFGDYVPAEAAAEFAIKWLDKSSADAIRCYYENPRVRP